jgi:hypothetical protein
MDEYGNWIYLTPMLLGAPPACLPLLKRSFLTNDMIEGGLEE